jgi:hypothetical protein
MGLQSRHSPPPSPEVEFNAQFQSRPPIRACSGWPLHTGVDSKTLATAEAQVVSGSCDTLQRSRDKQLN